MDTTRCLMEVVVAKESVVSVVVALGPEADSEIAVVSQLAYKNYFFDLVHASIFGNAHPNHCYVDIHCNKLWECDHQVWE